MLYSCPKELMNEKIICLDIETTGLDIRLNTIIQMGVIEWQKGKEVLSYETLFGGGRSSLFLSRRLHKIRDVDRKGKPTFKERASNIAKYLSNSIVVTHNGDRFDIPFINRVLSETDNKIVGSTFYDTLVMSRKLGNKINTLEALSAQYGLEYDEKNHTGLADARNTINLFFLFYDELKKKGK